MCCVWSMTITKIKVFQDVLNLPKIFLAVESCSKTVTTPGFRTAIVGTCLARMPNTPVNVGTSTCFTTVVL